MAWTRGVEDWARTTAPAPDDAIRRVETELSLRFPDAYVAFLQVTDGLLAHDHLSLYAVEDLVERNGTLEIQTYLPGHLAIGDDSGGRAVVIASGETTGPVYLMDTGSALLETRDVVASSLLEWLEQRCPDLA